MFSIKNNELSYVHNRKLLTLTKTKNETQLKYYKKDQVLGVTNKVISDSLNMIPVNCWDPTERRTKQGC